MTDLVDRLRIERVLIGEGVTLMCREAADEIERLRAINVKLVALSNSQNQEGAKQDAEIVRLRKSLQGPPSLELEDVEAAQKIVAGIKEMQGKQLRVAFQDEQTAQYITWLITNAGKVARALLALKQEGGR